MKNTKALFDVIVIGSGPAGQKAAVQSAKEGKKVAVVEQFKHVGGACVHRGTIPSKALREQAVSRGAVIKKLREMALSVKMPNTGVADLITGMDEVIHHHDEYMKAQLSRNGIHILHGRASFIDKHTLDIRTVTGGMESYAAENIVICTGSRPRLPDNVPIDHEAIYDSDSILSLAYLPQSMVVLGGGVIACEYASVFSMLGVEVTMVDRFPGPLGFLDSSLSAHFVAEFEKAGGKFLGNAVLKDCSFDGISEVITELEDGRKLKSEKLLCTLGRVSELRGLNAEAVGIEVSDNLLIKVSEFGQTTVPNIYAAGDVVGPPSLASVSMEQGRRAACHFLNLDPGQKPDWIPGGIYCIPELAFVGQTEQQVIDTYGRALVGRAKFSEIARGQISGKLDGFLKLVTCPEGIIRGVHIAGEQATELIHIGQMSLIQSANIEIFVENTFNFPTFAESYRVAALQIKAESRRVSEVA
ncbi:MAG: Si-specific NAD(P)(+) transhydrogenase [Pseudomonadales bacterium]|nr:Si-specific NAD(P)(+) transhydrogenase [Pseudomonadales bacterium]